MFRGGSGRTTHGMTKAKSEVNMGLEVGFNVEGTRTAVGRVSVEARLGAATLSLLTGVGARLGVWGTLPVIPREGFSIATLPTCTVCIHSLYICKSIENNSSELLEINQYYPKGQKDSRS